MLRFCKVSASAKEPKHTFLNEWNSCGLSIIWALSYLYQGCKKCLSVPASVHPLQEGIFDENLLFLVKKKEKAHILKFFGSAHTRTQFCLFNEEILRLRVQLIFTLKKYLHPWPRLVFPYWNGTLFNEET